MTRQDIKAEKSRPAINVSSNEKGVQIAFLLNHLKIMMKKSIPIDKLQLEYVEMPLFDCCLYNILHTLCANC